MKKLVILSIVMSALTMQARFHSIQSRHEFEHKINNFDYSLACFIDPSSGAGKQAKEAMRSLADSHDFRDLLQGRFGFLYVHVKDNRNQDLADEYGYKGKPLFMLFEREHTLKSTDLSGNYSRTSILTFINDELSKALDNLRDDVRDDRKELAKRREALRPHINVGFGTGVYPGYGYYYQGRPYWWHRRYGHYRHHHGGWGNSGFYFGISN